MSDALIHAHGQRQGRFQLRAAGMASRSGMWDQVMSSAAWAASAPSQVSCISAVMMTGVRFFIAGLVELAHHGMLVGIEREHREADHLFARSGVGRAVPQAGDAKGITASQFNPPAHRPAQLVTGFVEVVDQHQSVLLLPLPPGIAVAGFFGRGLAAGVVGMATDLVVLGPGRDQAELGETAGDTPALVALDDDGGSKTRIGLLWEIRRQIHLQVFLNPLGALGRREVRAHAGSLSLLIHNPSLCDNAHFPIL